LQNLDIDNEYEGVRYCPKWFGACPDNELKKNVVKNVVVDEDLMSSLTDSSEKQDENEISTKMNDIDYSNYKDLSDIDDISVALADAMLECDNERNSKSPDYFYPGISPRKDIDSTLAEYEDAEIIPESELFDNKVFPNPFMLSPEYVNTQESLYSLSENIECLDIYSLATKKNTVVNTEIESNRDEDINDKFVNFEKEKDLISDTVIVEQVLDRIIESIVRNNLLECKNPKPHSQEKALYSDIQTDKVLKIYVENNPEIKIDQFHRNNIIYGDFPNIDCFVEEENDNNDMENKNGNEDKTENDFEDDNNDTNDTKNNVLDKGQKENDVSVYFTPKKSESIQIKRNGNLLKVHETKKLDTSKNKNLNVAKSPTGESLERLPPWIAQMIRASTPTSPKQSDKKTDYFEGDLQKCLCIETQEEIELRKGQVELNKELIGIVQNANKYVEENMKLHSGSNTPKPGSEISSPVLARTSEQSEKYDLPPSELFENNREEESNNGSLFLAPLSASEADVFLNQTPSLKIIMDEKTEVDGADVTSKKCPYCSFETATSTKIVLPASLGEDQLKFMGIQAKASDILIVAVSKRILTLDPIQTKTKM
jgi:hypothetical protein